MPAADPEDVASPQALVTALYEVISGPAEEERNWDRFRSLFLPGARLVMSQTTPTGEERLRPMSVEDFIELASPLYRQAGFWERDIGSKVDRFGNVAHVFTAYETRRASDDGPVVARGINSVQLANHQGRWWVVNIAWDSERPDNRIPEQYLEQQNR